MEHCKLFRITNCDKIRKITVLAKSYEELLLKGSSKFGVPVVKCVLAETGDEIDETEVLQELPFNTQLMLLCPDEKWTDDSLTVAKDYNSNTLAPDAHKEKSEIPDTDSFEFDSTSIYVEHWDEKGNLEIYLPDKSNVELEKLKKRKIDTKIANCKMSPVHDDIEVVCKLNNMERDFEIIPVIKSENKKDSGKETDDDRNDYSFALAKVMIKELPIPIFDQRLIVQLESSNRISSSVHSATVQQTVEYYRTHIPNLKGYGGIYDLIAQKIVDKYPTLKSGGDHYWENFKKALSSRVRFLRYSEKVKDGPKIRRGPKSHSSKEDPLNEKLSASIDGSGTSVSMDATHLAKRHYEIQMTTKKLYTIKSQEEYMNINDIIRTQYEKHETSTNMSTRDACLKSIETGLADIFQNNAAWFKEVGNVSTIMDRYPCLKNGRLWILMFEMLLDDKHLHVLNHHLGRFEKAVQLIIKSEETPSMMELHDFIYDNTKVLKGVGQKSKPAIQILKDVPYDQIHKHLHSTDLDGFKIVAFGRGHDSSSILQSVFCVGHNKIIELPNEDLKSAVLCLFSIYYLLNLNYPKCYCGVLGFLQSYALGLPRYNLFKSSGYLRLSTIVEAALEKVTSSN